MPPTNESCGPMRLILRRRRHRPAPGLLLGLIVALHAAAANVARAQIPSLDGTGAQIDLDLGDDNDNDNDDVDTRPSPFTLDPILPWGRGPLPIRDPMPVSMLHLALHPISPEVTPPGEIRARLELTWANTFQLHDDVEIDAETRRLALELRDAINESLDFGIEIPIVWRGGGILDGVANGLHDAFGLPDGDRNRRPDDRYTVAFHDPDGDSDPSGLDDGTGLGDVILSLKYLAVEGPPPLTFLTELRLPTATGDFGADGIDISTAGVTSDRFFDDFVAYAGAGLTWYSDTTMGELRFHELRPYGFVALEWEVFTWASLLLQADIASPLLRSPDELDDLQSYTHIGARIAPWEDVELELGFVENIADQDSTADFAMFMALGVTF